MDKYLDNFREEVVMVQWFVDLGVPMTHVVFVRIRFCCIYMFWCVSLIPQAIKL